MYALSAAGGCGPRPPLWRFYTYGRTPLLEILPTPLLLTEVCSQVCVEPELQPVQHSDEFPLATSNTQDSARLDVAVNGFWGGRSERCFIDVRAFNPFAPSNSSSSLSSTFRKHEKIKHRVYGQRVREVEHATFTPIVLATTGGLAHEATVFYKRLASLLATKWGDDYSVVLGWLRCCLSFSLLRSAIQCIRGARSSIGVYTRTPQSVDFLTWPGELPRQPRERVLLFSPPFITLT